LEATIIVALRGFGVAGERSAGRPGVWVEGEKIAAIGVRVKGGVTTHGFALNVAPDLSWFDAIISCGLAGVRVTSMTRRLGFSPPMRHVEDEVAAAFGRLLAVDLVEEEQTDLLYSKREERGAVGSGTPMGAVVHGS